MIHFLFSLLLLFSTFSVYAESGGLIGTGELIPPVTQCSELYTLVGPDITKVGSTHEYSLVGSGGVEYIGPVIYTLRRDKKVVEVVNDRQKYVRYFVNPGNIELEANMATVSDIGCMGNISMDIAIYNQMFVTIGKIDTNISASFTDIFEEKYIFYENYPTLSDIGTGRTIWNAIEQSDILVVQSDDVLSVFSEFVKNNKTKPLALSKKKLYISGDYSRSFLSKVLAASLSQLGATRASLITSDQFYVLVTRISTGGELQPVGEELSYEKSKTVLSLSGFLEFLAYAGFSYQLLGFLLTITLVVLVLNILKQIIGFNVFGIYYPILLAITMVALGLSGSLMFIVIGFISILLVNTFTRRVHLLLHAKRALLISLYVLLFLLVIGVDNFFELKLIPYGLFDNTLIIFPFFVMIIIADKVFQDDINIWSRYGLMDLLQYIVITGIIYLLFEYNTLQYFLLSYPDSIILVVIANILVGRYVGLQLFEYFRFSSLLGRIDEEE